MTPEHQIAPAQWQALVQLHVAEYQALTNRSTYFIYIQSTLWTVVVLFLTLVSPMWNDARARYLAWATCLVVEFVLLALAENSWQQYNNIQYIENRLRPLIAGSITTQDFWLYERYLAEQRRDDWLWWEYGLSFAASGTVLTVVIFRAWTLLHAGTTWQECWWELVVVVITVSFVFILAKKARGLVALRKSLFRAVVAAKPPIEDEPNGGRHQEG